jgi:dUTP pyrophosphatase
MVINLFLICVVIDIILMVITISLIKHIQMLNEKCKIYDDELISISRFNEYTEYLRDMFDADLKILPESKDIKIPTRAHESDAGYDVYCPADMICTAGEDTLIPLGWSSSFNNGFAMIFKDKSGVATRDKLAVCSGVIDAAYRGIVTVHFRNESGTDITFTKGQKIAQFMMVPVWTGQPKVVDSLSETKRGMGGFGSTGTH